MSKFHGISKGYRALAGGIAVTLLWVQVTFAEEVTTTHQGMTLNGELQLAEGKTLTDGITLVIHGTLAHNKMEIIASLQELLAENEVSTLAINLSLGLDNRHGSYDCSAPHRHRHTDAVDEMGSWMRWLEQQGVTEINLMGHSRGSNQIAWLMAEQDRPSIHKGVLLAPPIWSEEKAEAEYLRRYQRELSPVYAHALQLVESGRGDEMLTETGFIYCEKATVSAEAFIGYYRPDLRHHTPGLLPKIDKPVMVMVGTEDTNYYLPLLKYVKPLAGGGLEFVEVEGAGHFFRDLYLEEVVEMVVEWLQG